MSFRCLKLKSIFSLPESLPLERWLLVALLIAADSANAAIQYAWLNQNHYNGFGYDTPYFPENDIQTTISKVIALSAQNEAAYPLYNSRFCTMTITGGPYKTGNAAYPYAIPTQNFVAASQGVGEPCYRYDSDKIHVKNMGVFVRAIPPKEAQCGQTCNGVAHPINPASGAVYDAFADFGPDGSMAFNRYYNSDDLGGMDIATGWRHSFGRSVTARSQPFTYHAYVDGDADNSSIYTDEATACTSGFAQIKARVSTWQNAVASYSNGVCILSAGSGSIGALPLFFNAPSLPAGSGSTVGYDITRDDGQVIHFAVVSGAITAPPDTHLKLIQTAGGYSVIDGNDSVETYDTSGMLLSVTDRSGVVQSMSYDASGRLSSVTDSFGHQLTLGYDAQGRLTSVTRQ